MRQATRQEVPENHNDVQCSYYRLAQLEKHGDKQKMQNDNQGTSDVVTEGIETQQFRGAIRSWVFGWGTAIWLEPNSVRIKPRY